MDIKTSYYMQRKQCLCRLKVPSISRVRELWGPTFSETFFSECPELLKYPLGLIPTLKGAGENLWISPSDLLIGKVVLKPPLTSKHVKALTHEGILEMGRIIEERFLNEQEALKIEELINQENLLNLIFKRNIKRAVEDVRYQEQLQCALEKEKLREEFLITLQNELENLYNEMMALKEEELLAQSRADKNFYEKRQQAAVFQTVRFVSKKFIAEMQVQIGVMQDRFDLMMEKQQKKLEMTVADERQKCYERFCQLKHKMECKNLANLMYFLCMERQKCQAERMAAELELNKEIQRLHDEILEKDVEIGKLRKMANDRQEQLKLREDCLKDVICQFQKFINFALRAAPTQGEFLLSVEKMLVFELAQAVMQLDQKGRDKLAKMIVPWKDGTKNVPTTSDIYIKDYHRCLDELTPPASDRSTLRASEDLPAFLFNKHMYVREDFRNMVSQGIEITPSSLLWNRDIEHLQILLKTSIESLKGEEESTEENSFILSSSSSSSSSSTTESEVVQRQRPSSDSYESRNTKGSVRYSIQTTETFKPYKVEEDDIQSVVDAKFLENKRSRTRSSMTSMQRIKNARNRRATLKTSYDSLARIDYTKIGAFENKKSIIATRNSVEIVKKTFQRKLAKKKVKKEEKAEKATLQLNVNALKPEDEPSIDFTGSDKSCSYREEKFEIIRPSFSERLSLARDSFEKHKQSLLLKADDSKCKSVLSLTRDSLEIPTNAPRKQSEPKVEIEEPVVVSLGKPSKSLLRSTEFDKPPSETETRQEEHRYSKLSMARNSVEIIRASIKSVTEDPIRRISKLSAHKNSLEIYRSPRVSVQLKEDVNSMEIYDGYIKNAISAATSPMSIIKLDDETPDEKTVKLSHIEVVKVPALGVHPSTVSFVCPPHIYEAPSSTSFEAPIEVYEKKKCPKKTVKRDNFLKKKNKAKILGKRDAKEHEQSQNEFTADRTNSFIALIKDHPNLIQMFTACTK